MLAYQNLQVGNAFKEDAVESQNVEIHALEASLFMMQRAYHGFYFGLFADLYPRGVE